MLRYRPVFLFVLLAAVASPCSSFAANPVADIRDLTRIRAYEQARIDLIKRCRPAVACIFPEGSRQGGGSGVVIDEDGYGLTNFHVVAGMMEKRVGQAGFDDKKLYNIEVLGVDPTGDVAMFRVVDRKPMHHAELGWSDTLRVGDFTMAIGNPFLLAEDFVPTVTLGIISGLHRYQAGAGPRGRALRYTDCIQVDTSINPGNSGGPLFDMTGRVIGINGRVSIEERGRVNVGVGYAISINQIRRFLPALRAGITTKHATAGFTVADRGNRVIVDQILDDSPAYKVGVRLGDELISFDGTDIVSANQFGSLLGVYPDAWPVTASFRRKDTTFSPAFRLEDMPFPEDVAKPMEGAPNLLAVHPITAAGNRRAVDRIWRLNRQFVGDDAMLNQIGSILYKGVRELNASRAIQGGVGIRREAFEIEETDTPAPADKAVLTPAEIERRVRWFLIKRLDRIDNADIKVIGGDEIADRVCTILEAKFEHMPEVRIALDDTDGRLMRIGFDDAVSGRAAAFLYSEHKLSDGFRWPTVRIITIDDEPFAVDAFETIKVLD